MRGRNLTLMGFILICGLVAYTDLKKCHRLPWPPRFIFAALAFLMMELVTLLDETLGGVTTIGFVIAIFVKELTPGSKGIMRDCEPGVSTTGQPQQTTLVGDVTSTPDAGSGAMASVAEYQQSQAAPMPGVVT